MIRAWNFYVARRDSTRLAVQCGYAPDSAPLSEAPRPVTAWGARFAELVDQKGQT